MVRLAMSLRTGTGAGPGRWWAGRPMPSRKPLRSGIPSTIAEYCLTGFSWTSADRSTWGEQVNESARDGDRRQSNEQVKSRKAAKATRRVSE